MHLFHELLYSFDYQLRLIPVNLMSASPGDDQLASGGQLDKLLLKFIMSLDDLGKYFRSPNSFELHSGKIKFPRSHRRLGAVVDSQLSVHVMDMRLGSPFADN